MSEAAAEFERGAGQRRTTTAKDSRPIASSDVQPPVSGIASYIATQDYLKYCREVLEVTEAAGLPEATESVDWLRNLISQHEQRLADYAEHIRHGSRHEQRYSAELRRLLVFDWFGEESADE